MLFLCIFRIMDIPSSQSAQPDYDAIIQQRFADLEARQMEFNNQLWEAVRMGNAQTAYETHQRLTEQIERERELFLKFIQSQLNLYQPLLHLLQMND